MLYYDGRVNSAGVNSAITLLYMAHLTPFVPHSPGLFDVVYVGVYKNPSGCYSEAALLMDSHGFTKR